MSDQDGFDARLAAHFENEHPHFDADSFVADTMREIRAARRRREFMHVGWRAAALVAAAVASPWLIAGVAHINTALERSLTWATGELGGWVLGAVAVVFVLAMRVRSR